MEQRLSQIGIVLSERLEPVNDYSCRALNPNISYADVPHKVIPCMHVEVHHANNRNTILFEHQIRVSASYDLEYNYMYGTRCACRFCHLRCAIYSIACKTWFNSKGYRVRTDAHIGG